MGCTSKNSDAIATALRDGLKAQLWYGPHQSIVSALTPVVERLLAEQDKGWASWWAFVFETGIPGSVVRDQFTREELRSHISERWDGLEARAAEAERRLREIAAKVRCLPSPLSYGYSMDGGTKQDKPFGPHAQQMWQKCLWCGAEWNRHLSGIGIAGAMHPSDEKTLPHPDNDCLWVLALLDTGAGQGEKT